MKSNWIKKAARGYEICGIYKDKENSSLIAIIPSEIIDKCDTFSDFLNVSGELITLESNVNTFSELHLIVDYVAENIFEIINMKKGVV